MKKQDKELLSEQQERQGQRYEKPQLSKVKLFADDVLSACSAVSGCTDEPCKTGGF
jgi:hypothetical protein